MRKAPYKHSRWTEALDGKTMFGEGIGRSFQAVATGFLQFDHFGYQESLTSRDGFFRPRRLEGLNPALWLALAQA